MPVTGKFVGAIHELPLRRERGDAPFFCAGGSAAPTGDLLNHAKRGDLVGNADLLNILRRLDR